MKSRPDLKSRALVTAVLFCVPLVARCGSDSEAGGTSGASGEVEQGAGTGGLAPGGDAGSAGSTDAGSNDAGSDPGTAGDSGSGGTEAAGAAGEMSTGAGGTTAGSGGAGVGGGTGGAGGGGGSAGPGFLKASTSSLVMMGDCTVAPQTFTLSNTGQSPLTWNAALAPALLAVAPASSTLQPGAEVTVSVGQTTPVQLSLGQNLALTITSDVPAQPPTAISVFYMARGTMIGVQPDIDVGEVRLGQSKTVSVPAPPHSVELALGSGNSPVFSISEPLVHGADHWTMVFTPAVLGPQSVTLSIIVPFGPGGPACPNPNLFTARGTGIAP